VLIYLLDSAIIMRLIQMIMAPDGKQPEINQSLDPAPKAEEVMSHADAALNEHSDKPAMSLVTPADKAKPAEAPKVAEAPKAL
jgi:hypothetical protein